MKQAHRCGGFFGNPSRSHHGAGIALSHRIAAGDVEPHDYVSSATGEGSNAPHLIYNPAGIRHRDRFLDGKGSFFAISLGEPFLGRRCHLPSAAMYVSNPSVRGVVLTLMGEFWEGPDSRLLVEGLCTELIAALIGACEERKPPGWLARAREVLHERVADAISLADIAGEIGVHPIHFTRAFRKAFGCTPGVYLRACRLQRSVDLLRRSEAALPEIALASGFSDQSHFTHRFTRHFGVPPGAYRRLTA